MVTTPLVGRRPWDKAGGFSDGTLIFSPLKSPRTLPQTKGAATRPQLREEDLEEEEEETPAEA